MEHGIECNHEPCSCLVTGSISEEAYCSDGCRSASQSEIESELETCSCGHPPCDAV